MDVSRKRRIAKRVALTLAAFTLLLSGYVSVYGLTFWLLGRGTIPVDVVIPLERSVFAPIVNYHGPGSETLMRWRGWCYFKGAGRTVEWNPD